MGLLGHFVTQAENTFQHSQVNQLHCTLHDCMRQGPDVSHPLQLYIPQGYAGSL